MIKTLEYMDIGTRVFFIKENYTEKETLCTFCNDGKITGNNNRIVVCPVCFGLKVIIEQIAGKEIGESTITEINWHKDKSFEDWEYYVGNYNYQFTPNELFLTKKEAEKKLND
jgi:hypothetical protein